MLRKQFQLAGDDLDLSTGNLIVLDPAEALAQRIRTRLQTFFGEIFTNESLGVPYFQSIFQEKNPKVSVLNAGFVTAIESVDGVSNVDNIEYDLLSNRQLDVSIVITGEDETAIDLEFTAEV